MSRKALKRFLIPLLVVLAAGAAFAWWKWNEPHPKAEDEAGIAVSATSLYAAFKADEQAANKQYLNQVLVVSGDLISKEKNQEGQTVALLRGEAGDDPLAGVVMCTLRDTDAHLRAQPTIRLKGFCTGFINDVHLTDCIIVQP